MTNIFDSLKDSEVTNRFYPYETGKSIHRIDENILGSSIKHFTVNFIKIIDEVIITDNRYLFTKEQQSFFEKFLTEVNADSLTDEMQQFDEFLGSYLGG